VVVAPIKLINNFVGASFKIILALLIFLVSWNQDPKINENPS